MKEKKNRIVEVAVTFPPNTPMSEIRRFRQHMFDLAEQYGKAADPLALVEARIHEEDRNG